MNTSLRTFFRPAVVAVIAVTLAGCASTSPSEPAGNLHSQPAATTAHTDVTVDQAGELEDDEDEVDKRGLGDVDGAGASAGDWALAVPERDWGNDPSIRPPAPTPLVDYLPESSVLRADNPELSIEFQQALSSPDPQAAAAVAVLTLQAATPLVREGHLAGFAPAAASSCGYCLGKLQAAYAIHDLGGEFDNTWAIDTEPDVEWGELSGADHLALKFRGEENSLVYQIGNVTTVSHGEGHQFFHVEMLYDQGQWWILGVGSEAL